VSFLEHGYEIIPDVINSRQIEAIKHELLSSGLDQTGGGIRNVEKKLTSVATLSSCPELLQQASKYLDKPIQLVRAILFNKSADQNWLVTWHQDKTVALTSRIADTSWGPLE